MEEILKVINKEEKSNSITFEKSLNTEDLEQNSKRKDLVKNLENKVLSGNGDTKYIIGVDNKENINGISEEKFNETVDVLNKISKDNNFTVTGVEKFEIENHNYVGIVNIEEEKDNHIIIGTAGHVDHGKSTLVGSLVSGKSDNGSGSVRRQLDKLPHEIERGLSADLSYSVYGFDSEGNILNLNSSTGSNKSEVVEKSDKIVSFVDTVGHKPWLHTTIRGLSQQLDYGLLTVSANEGVTETTKEHLGILIAMDIPTIITITKIDLVEEEQIDNVISQVNNILQEVGNKGIECEKHNVNTIKNKISSDIYPIIKTSSVSREGLDELNELFYELPERTRSNSDEFKMYIDETYTVEGVGTVISGAIKSGNIKEGDELILGPFSDGEYKKTKAKSLEIHYHSVDKAEEGQLVSMAISDISEEEINRGMCVISPNSEHKNSVRRFKAEVIVLNHPTSIRDGYEPVIHMESINETSVVKTKEALLPGEKGEIEFEFKFNQYNLEKGQRFIFREGESKGIGTVKEIIK